MPEPLLTASLMIAGYTATAALSRPGTAVSRESVAVQEHACNVVRQVQSSQALFGSKAKLISELMELAADCREVDWDGYGAQPVDSQALEVAQAIISSLPDDLALPECSIEPDGCVSLDWMPTNVRTLTLSAEGSGRIPYAWVDGTDRGHAVGRFQGGELSSRIIEEIGRFSCHASSLRAA